MWFFLLPAALVLVAASLASYDPAIRSSRLFPVAMALAGSANAVLWAYAARLSRSPNDLFALSLAWDALTIVAYSALPVMCSGVRLNVQMVVGLVLVVAGTITVKLAEPCT